MCDWDIDRFKYFFDKSELNFEFYFFLYFFECGHSYLHKLSKWEVLELFKLTSSKIVGRLHFFLENNYRFLGFIHELLVLTLYFNFGLILKIPNILQLKQKCLLKVIWGMRIKHILKHV